MSNERTQKVGLLLAELTDDPGLKNKKVRKRESDELRTKNNNHRILENPIKLDLGINSFVILFEAPTVDPKPDFLHNGLACSLSDQGIGEHDT
jgi:hypothetical protein